MSWKSIAGLSLVLSIASVAGAGGPRKVLLIGDKGSHGHGAHEHMPGLRVLAKCLEGVQGLKVSLHQGDGKWPEGPELIEGADGIVLFMDTGMEWEQRDPRRRKALERLLARGSGVVGIHWACGGRTEQHIPFHLKLMGGCHGGKDRKYTHADAQLKVANPKHPVTYGIQDFRLKDEFYYQLKWVKEGKLAPLLTATIRDCPDQAVAWALERPDGGRSFGFVCMHFHANWGRVECRRLIAQAVLWTLKLPVPEGGLPVKVSAEDLKLPPKK
jgi:type 1 glutamine amidotransferase